MSDREFVARWVPNTYSARLQRRAVLYPLVGRAKNAAAVVTRTKQVVRMWRARLHALHQIGWTPGSRDTDMQYARNCHPTFMFAEPQTRQCRIRHLCPFCYARWVNKMWETLDNVFPNPRDVPDTVRLQSDNDDELNEDIPETLVASSGEHAGRNLRSIHLDGEQQAVEDPQREFPYHLITRRLDLDRPFVRPNYVDESPTSYAAHLLSSTAAARTYVVGKMDPLGCFAFTTMVPADAGWRVSHREIHMVPSTYVLPDDIGGDVYRLERPSRRRIFHAVANTFVYPSGLITGDVELTKAVLEARRGLRLSAVYGVFRTPKRRV